MSNINRYVVSSISVVTLTFSISIRRNPVPLLPLKPYGNMSSLAYYRKTSLFIGRFSKHFLLVLKEQYFKCFTLHAYSGSFRTNAYISRVIWAKSVKLQKKNTHCDKKRKCHLNSPPTLTVSCWYSFHIRYRRHRKTTGRYLINLNIHKSTHFAITEILIPKFRSQPVAELNKYKVKGFILRISIHPINTFRCLVLMGLSVFTFSASHLSSTT